MSENTSFVIFSGFLIIALCLILILYLSRNQNQRNQKGPELEIYQQQLNEVTKDLRSGLLSTLEEDNARREIKQRILRSHTHSKENFSHPPKKIKLVVAIITLCFFSFSSFVLYYTLGSFGQTDQHIEKRLNEISKLNTKRPSQKNIEQQAKNSDIIIEYDQEYLDLISQLRQAVKKNNNDINGLKLLVKYENSIKRYIAAHIAQKKLIEKLGNKVTAEEYIDHAELLIKAANGYISPEAEISLKKALSLDKDNRRGRYFTGLLLLQLKRPDLTLKIWQKMLTDIQIDDNWSEKIRFMITEVERQAGLRNE